MVEYCGSRRSATSLRHVPEIKLCTSLNPAKHHVGDSPDLSCQKRCRGRGQFCQRCRVSAFLALTLHCSLSYKCVRIRNWVGVIECLFLKTFEMEGLWNYPILPLVTRIARLVGLSPLTERLGGGRFEW